VPIRKILVLADGDWQDLPSLRRLQSDADLTIAADGAWGRARRAGLHIDRVIGDLDSLLPEDQRDLESSGTPVDRYPTEKDQTDLELCIEYALSLQSHEIIVFGALGGRTDHALTNLHLLEKSADSGSRITLIHGDEAIYLVSDRLVFETARIGDGVSLIPLTESVLVSTEGLHYGLQDERLLRASSRGVSNWIEKTPARIDVRDGRVLVIHKQDGERGS
jgi:thiamine pyrophosphokinase